MGVKSEDFIRLFDLLPEPAKHSAYDFVRFLAAQHLSAAEPLSAEKVLQIKESYHQEIQEFKNKYGTLEALMQKENKTDKERDDLDNWLFYLDQLHHLAKIK